MGVSESVEQERERQTVMRRLTLSVEAALFLRLDELIQDSEVDGGYRFDWKIADVVCPDARLVVDLDAVDGEREPAVVDRRERRDLSLEVKDGLLGRPEGRGFSHCSVRPRTCEDSKGLAEEGRAHHSGQMDRATTLARGHAPSDVVRAAPRSFVHVGPRRTRSGRVERDVVVGEASEL